MCTVSVIIPVFNGSLYLQETMESVLNQTYGDIEVIVVDDGSTDATPGILASYGDRVQVLQQQRQGPSVGRNAGVKIASGKWIAFLDADDLWLPEKIDRQMCECSSQVISHTNSWFFGEELAEPFLKTSVCPQYRGRALEHLVLGNFITTSTVMVQRDVFWDYGGFDPTYKCVMDWPLWMKICADHELGYVETPLARYRVHPHSITRKVRETLPTHLRLLNEAFGSQGAAQDLQHLRRRAVANSYNVNAHFAAMAGDWRFSAYCAMRSCFLEPFAQRSLKTVVKALLMPLGVKY